MPKKLSVESLRLLCLNNVAKHFERFWFSPFEKLFGNSSRLMHVLGPFDHITSDLNRDLIHVLIDKKQLKLKHFQLLLNNRLTELDLREARFIANQESIIDTIAYRCQRLMKLNLDNYNRISAKSWNNLVTNLTSLRHLSLQSTKCNDAVMKSIGSCCTELIELDITGCINISEKGFQPLIQLKDGEIEFFKKLLLLKVSLTKISPFTAGKMVALRKNLDVQYGRTCEMIAEAYDTASGQSLTKSDQCPIHLLSTEEQLEELTVDQILLTCAYCPNITEVILHGILPNECLQSLRKLSNLRKLEIAFGGGEDDKKTFEEGILPLLLDSGHRLLELNLHEIDNVCLASIGTYCMNLQKLKCTLRSVSYVTLPEKIETKIYTKLTHLDLRFVSNTGTIPSCILKAIMTNAKLIKSIYLSNTESLTTELMLQVLETNTFISLNKLVLEHCNSITEEAIFKLLSQDSDLENCALLHCHEITLADFEKFKKFVKKNKLKLEITWV